MNIESEMLDVESAANIANITKNHLRELLRLGKIKAIKSGKQWRIAKEDLNNYLGIKTDIKSFEREIYIKELESENRELKLKLNLVKNSILTLLDTIKG